MSVTDLLDTPAAGPAAIRGGQVRVASFFAGMLVGVGSFALLARHLGVEDVGRYSVVVALVTVLGGLSDLGLTAVGVRELSIRVGEDKDRFARNLLGLRLIVCVVGGICMVGFVAVAGYDRTLVAGVALGAVGLVLQSWQATLEASLMSGLRLGRAAGLDLLRAILNGALVAILVLAGAGLFAFLAVAVPVGVVVLVINALMVRGQTPLLPAFHVAHWRELLGSALPYAAATAAAVIYVQLDVVIVSLLADSNEVGYFATASRTIQMLLMVSALAVGAALPIFARAARDDRERLAYALGRVFEVSLLLGVGISLLVGIGAPVAIRLVAGPEFAPASQLLAIQSAGLAAGFVGAVAANGLLSLGRMAEILRINLVALIFGGGTVALLVWARRSPGSSHRHHDHRGGVRTRELMGAGTR